MSNSSVYSDLKPFYHFDRMKSLAEGKRVAPIYVRIKPTNVCNQKCNYCAYADKQSYDNRNVSHNISIPWNIMQGLLEELNEIGVKALTFSGGGEPLCYSNIYDTFSLAEKYKFDCSIITNGQALSGDIVKLVKDFKWVRVSFDSSKYDTYEKIRNVNTFGRVVDNISNFASVKNNDCTLGINCVVTKDNYMEIYDICKLVQGLGVDNIKIAPLLLNGEAKGYHDDIREEVKKQISFAKREMQNDRFCIHDKYSNDLGVNNQFEKNYNRCWIQELFCVIAADSNIYRCHQRAYMPVGRIGDLNEKSFKDIWFSEKTRKCVENFDAKELCDFRCVFEERNILLNQFFDMDLNHVNFI